MPLTLTCVLPGNVEASTLAQLHAGHAVLPTGHDTAHASLWQASMHSAGVLFRWLHEGTWSQHQLLHTHACGDMGRSGSSSQCTCACMQTWYSKGWGPEFAANKKPLGLCVDQIPWPGVPSGLARYRSADTVTYCFGSGLGPLPGVRTVFV